MRNLSSKTVYTSTADHIELRPPKAGRTFLEIVNEDAAAVYVSEDMMASSENGVPIAANSTRTWGATGNSPFAVPQGSVWILGSVGTRQRVIVREA